LDASPSIRRRRTRGGRGSGGKGSSIPQATRSTVICTVQNSLSVCVSVTRQTTFSVCLCVCLSVTVLYVCKLTMELHDHIHKHAKDNDSGGFEACLGPELDGKGDSLHGVGMAPDEEAPKQDPRQPIPLGIQVSQVTDVVGHHPTQASG